MSTSTIIWIVVAVVIVLVVIAVLSAVLGKSRKTKRRGKAGRLRQQAAAQAPEVHRKAGDAQQAETESHRKHQEAERKRVEAEQAEHRAQEARRGQVAAEAGVEDRVRAADRVDPDVDHRARDYSPDTRAAQQGGPTGTPPHGTPSHDGGRGTHGGHDTDGTPGEQPPRRR